MTKIEIESKIEKLQKAINSKATDKRFIPKLKAEKEKFEGELAKLSSNKPAISRPASLKTSSSKVAKAKSILNKYKYLPNRNVDSVVAKNNGKKTTIDSKDILDGVYVKKEVKYAKGGQADGLDKVREKVNNFLNPLGYSARVEKSIGDVLYIIEPDTRKVGKNRSDFFDGMQILGMDNGSFEVSEYQAGANENELYIYKETKSLILALKDLIKGNKRKPIKKYAKGGQVKVVLDEGNGKVINKLYNEWDNVKTQAEYDKWVKKVQNTKFGTYGTITFAQMLKNFDFDNAPISSFKLKTFKKELESALNKYADGGYMAKGGNVSKGELVWRKLTQSQRLDLLHKNFTPQITPRSQEILVGKPYNFLPKNIKIVIESKYSNDENYSDGGYMAKVGEVDEELLRASAKSVYDAKGMMALRNIFLQLANTDESNGDVETANYRRKIVKEYQDKQPKYMAKGGEADKDYQFTYMMLDRLRSDNDYYLGYGNRSERNLWAGNVNDQIAEMKKLWNELPKDKKPEWLSMEDILEYEKNMKNDKMADGGNTNVSRDRMFKSQQKWEQDYKRKTRPKNPHYKKLEDGGGIDLLADTSGAGLQNVGGSSFSNVDLTSHMDLTNPMFAKGGQTQMKKEKSFYQDLPIYKGYKWSGFWDGFHHFVKSEGKGYYEIKVTDKDIQNGNYKDMIDYGYSYAKGGELQDKINHINETYDGVTASKTYSDNRIQVVSPYFNTLNEIKRKEFDGSGLMERYGNTSSYVLYSNKTYEQGGEMFAHGGNVPTNFGKGKNINVFGYETKFFINCPKAVEEFENSIQHANTDEEKENLSKLAEHIDKIFEIEHEVVHGIAPSQTSFDEAIKETITASYWNYRSGMAIDLFSFIPQHLKEIALRLNNTKFEDGGVLNLLSDTSGAELHNVGGSSFSNVDLTPQMDITNPMFANGGGTFNVQEFRDLLGEGVTNLYRAENNFEVAIRYMEINGQGGMVSAFKNQYRIDELKSITRKLDDASENKYAHGGQTKQKYKIFEGYDSYKNNPIYSVHGVDNDYFGEWHTSKEGAEQELNELNKKHYAKGGGIPNNYRGRTTEDIWNSLTENQRVHFLFDHFDELGTNESELVRLANKEFEDLNEDVQDAFKRHTMMGQYAHGGLTEHGLKIGDKIIDRTSFSENGISVMNDGKYAMVDLDKGERIEGIYADGGQVNDKFQIVNSKGYFSRSMKTGKPIFMPNFELGYLYTKDDANKMLEFLKKEINDSELKVVPFGSVKFNDEYADGGMMAKGGNVGTWTFHAVTYNDDEVGAVKEMKVFKVKASTRSGAYDKAYKKYPRPYFVELYSVDYADGGETDGEEDMGVQFIDYKDEMIMYEPHYKEYYTNDIQFDSLEKAKKYIDNGSKMTPAQINLYRKGAMANGGSINKYFLRWDSINSRGGVNRNNKELSELPKNIVVNQSNYVYIKKDTINGKDYVPVRIIGGFKGVQLSEQEVKDKKIKRIETMEFAKGGKTTFNDKVKAISQSLLKRKKVSPSVQKDYGKTYDKKEAVDSAKRIAGAIRKKELAKKKS
jgi:hypothetical protein